MSNNKQNERFEKLESGLYHFYILILPIISSSLLLNFMFHLSNLKTQDDTLRVY